MSSGATESEVRFLDLQQKYVTVTITTDTIKIAPAKSASTDKATNNQISMIFNATSVCLMCIHLVHFNTEIFARGKIPATVDSSMHCYHPFVKEPFK